MRTIEQLFIANKIVPVVVIEDLTAAIPLAETLLAAGINTMEITLRTKNALEIIQVIDKKLPEMVVGAGTIRTAADFANACYAGAKYIISPGITQELLTAAKGRHSNVRFVPGVVTPSQAMECAANGINYLKFFPAEAYNAYAVIQALSAPFPDIKFCPTGGITLENFGKYLQLSNVFAVGMSSIVDHKLIAAHDFAEIKQRCAEVGRLSKKFLNL